MFPSQKPILLIIGGSQGAKFINQIVWANVASLSKNFNIVHCTGKGNINPNIKNPNYVQFDYVNNIGDFYSATDIAISRAGCGVISELKAKHIPSLLIPLSKKCSRGDQIENAKLFKSFGYCEMMEEEEYSKQRFLKILEKLSQNQKKYTENMKKDKNLLANDKIIELIKSLT